MTVSASPPPNGVPISFGSNDGQVRGRLYEPSDPRPGNPAVVVSPSRVSTVEEMGWLAEPLAVHWHGIELESYWSKVIARGACAINCVMSKMSRAPWVTFCGVATATARSTSH